MALARFEPRQCGVPQFVAEPVEKRSAAPSHSLSRKREREWMVAGCVADEADLLGGQRLDRQSGEDHIFDAEARINGVEAFFEEGCEVARITARASGAEPDPLDSAIDAVKAEVEPPGSDPLARQAGDEIGDEPL